MKGMNDRSAMQYNRGGIVYNACSEGWEEAKSILWIAKGLGFRMDDPPPSDEIQKNQKKMFGFEWEEL